MTYNRATERAADKKKISIEEEIKRQQVILLELIKKQEHVCL